MRGLLLVTLIAGAPAATRADSLAEEVSAGTTLEAPDSSWIANRTSGVWDVDDVLTVQLDLSVTRSSTTSTSGSVALSYTPTDHWSLGIVAGMVPAATTASRTELALDDVTFADAELSATTSSTSLTVSAGYDTAGGGDHETSVTLSLGVAHHQSQQTFASILDADGAMLVADDVRAHCMTRSCSPEIMAALSPLWSQLSQFSITASVMQTEYKSVDLALDASYYFYDADPTVAGRFLLPGRGPSHLGNGISISPLRYVVAPAIGTRWGTKLYGTLGFAYGSEVANRGYELGANLRVQYKLSAVRVYASAATAWGVDASVQLTTSLSLSLGGKYAW